MRPFIALPLALCALAASPDDESLPLANRSVTTWTSDDVASWFADLGLKDYAAAVASEELDGAGLAAKGIDALAGTLQIANPVHKAKLAAHIAAVTGHCPCALAQATLNVWTVFDRYYLEVYLLTIMLSESPRSLLMFMHYYGYDWSLMVNPPATSGAAWSLSHRPEPYHTSTNDTAAAPAAGDDANNVSLALLFVQIILVPNLTLIWGATAFWSTNPYITSMLVMIILHEQISEVVDVLSLDLSGVTSDSSKIMEIVQGFGLRILWKWPLIPIVIVLYLTTYVFPVWLIKTIVSAFILFLLVRTVISIINALSDAVAEDAEAQRAEEEAAAQAKAGTGATEAAPPAAATATEDLEDMD